MNPAATTRLLLGIVAVASTTYFLDPTSGRRRRAAVRERLAGAASRFNDGTRDVRHDLSDRVQRVAGSTKTLFRRNNTSDEALCRRVRTAVRRTVPRPGAVSVAVSDGRIFLHGDVLRHEHEPLLQAVRSKVGVNDLTDHLVERENIAGASSFPVTSTSKWKRHLDLRQEHWSPAARLFAGLMGAALVGYAARHRNPLGFLGGAAGSSMLLRSATNAPLKRFSRGQGVIDVHKTLVIRAPVERVFGLLEACEVFPSFMRNVREVRRQDNGRSHWVVSGPAGSSIEWDSIMTVHRPHEMLAWQAAPGSKIEHSGVIRFERLGDDQTRLDISMAYSPPAGAVGHLFAKAFSADPSTELDADLGRLKSVAESWETWKSSIEAGREGRESAQTARMRSGAKGSQGTETHVT